MKIKGEMKMKYLKSKNKEEVYIFEEKSKGLKLVGKMYGKEGLTVAKQIADKMDLKSIETMKKIELLNLMEKEKRIYMEITDEVREKVKEEMLELFPSLSTEEQVEMYLKIEDDELKFYFYKHLKDKVQFK